MRQVPPTKEKLFKRFKGGDGRALPDLLDSERSLLFDYVLRMTGQITKATDTVDEVFQSLNEDSLEATGSFTDLHLLLFTTARRFTADVWNAETPRLMNAALEGDVDGHEPSEKALRERQFYRPLDKSLRSLPGREREVVLLHARADFDWDEIAEIMGIGSALADRTFQEAMARIERDCPGLVGADQALAKMPAHPEPERSSQRTINLSMVMQGIKAKPVGLWSPMRIAIVIGIVVVAVLAITQPELFVRLFAAIRELLADGAGHGS